MDNYFFAMQQTFSASCSPGISCTVSHRWVSEDLLSEGCCVWLFSFHGCLVGRVGFVRSVKLQERISYSINQGSIVSPEEQVVSSQRKHCKTKQDRACAALQEADLVLTRT